MNAITTKVIKVQRRNIRNDVAGDKKHIAKREILTSRHELHFLFFGAMLSMVNFFLHRSKRDFHFSDMKFPIR